VKSWISYEDFSDINFENKIVIPYSRKYGLKINGTYYSPDSSIHSKRLVFWADEVTRFHNKKIVLLAEKDYQWIQKNDEDVTESITTIDEFFASQEFQDSLEHIANRYVYIDSMQDYTILLHFLDKLRRVFMKGIYSNDREFVAPKSELLFLNTINLLGEKHPVIKETLIKLIPYFPKNDTHFTYYQWYVFADYFLRQVPKEPSFDNDLMSTILEKCVSSFSKEEIQTIEEWTNSESISSLDSINISDDSIVKFMHEHMKLLVQSNYLNLNNDDTQTLLAANANLFLRYLIPFVR
jgi:hypothetical protein